MVTNVPAVVAGSKFQFLQNDQGTIPNNCPLVVDKNNDPVNLNPETGEMPATKKYETLGIYPPMILFGRGFAEDPQFDWKGYWEKQCSGNGLTSTIDPNTLLKDFDEMQKQRLGNLVTGVTTFAGNIGQKAIRDGDEKFAAKIYDQLTGFAKYIEKGREKRKFPESEKKKTACDGDRSLYCDDALARTYLGVGKMAVAAVASGLASKKGKPVKISRSMVNRTIEKDELGDPPSKDDFLDNPYKATMETLMRCMVESEDGSLKRDICTEMIKDVVVAGIKAGEDHVYNDGIDHLGGYYDKAFFEGKKDNWDNLKTWVNSTVWMADGLIELMEARDAGKLKNDEGIKELISAIEKQKKEGLMEFSTADWISQQALIITANKGKSGIYNNHDKVIGGFIKDGKRVPGIIEDRLSVWNPWLDLYTDSFKQCPPENKECMGNENSDANKALRQLATSINNGCFAPVVIKDDRSDLDKEAIANCSKAMAAIIKKAGDESVLRAATEAWFLFGQDNGGIKYVPEIKEALDEAINERFTSAYILKMKGSSPTDFIKEGDATIQAYNTDLFSRRYERPATPEEKKILNDIVKREKPSNFSWIKDYFLDTKIVDGQNMGTKIVKDDGSPSRILESYKEKVVGENGKVRWVPKTRLLPKSVMTKFEKQMK